MLCLYGVNPRTGHQVFESFKTLGDQIVDSLQFEGRDFLTMSSPARTLLGKEGFDDGAGRSFKGLVLGASQSGKSSLIQRFAHN